GAETADQPAPASDGAPVMNGLLLGPPSRATSSELRRELLCNSVCQHPKKREEEVGPWPQMETGISSLRRRWGSVRLRYRSKPRQPAQGQPIRRRPFNGHL